VAVFGLGGIGLAVGAARCTLLEVREQGRLGMAVQTMRTEFTKETKRA
jgi:hypothetical protein